MDGTEEVELLTKANSISDLGKKIRILSAIRDHCNPTDDSICELWSRLNTWAGDQLDSINFRAMMSMIIRDGLEREMKQVRNQIQELARSMADAEQVGGDGNLAI